MKNRKKILEVVIIGWKCIIKHWRIILLNWLVNYIFATLVLSPLFNTINSATANRLRPKTISLTYIHDLLQNDLHIINNGLSLLLPILALYLIWSVFSAGGIIHVLKTKQSDLKHFFAGGSIYFFRFLRLGLYTLGILGFFILILYKIMTHGDINVFMIESEVFLIHRFIILNITLAIGYFLIKLWNDWLKLKISTSSNKTFFNLSLTACKQIANLRLLAVFLLNAILCITLVYLLKMIPTKSGISILLITQLVILVRMSYKVANLGSLEYLSRKER